jgi:hypothetical protein
MQVYLSHQTELVDIFSLLSRDMDIFPFMVKYQAFLSSLKKHIMTEKNPTLQKAYFLILTLLYKLIPYTRDIYGGLGERKLSYMMLFIWNYQFPVPAAYCLQKMVLPIEGNPSYGSWRDIKNMCLFVREFSEMKDRDPFIETCIAMMNHQLDIDYSTWNRALEDYIRKLNTGFAVDKPTYITAGISLVSKWIPREGSAFDWLNKRCALQWIRSFKPEYLDSCTNDRQFKAALRKGSKEYRHVFARLSKVCDTLEIKQCSRQWDTIKIADVPFLALHRQQQSLLNISLTGEVRRNRFCEMKTAMNIQAMWRGKQIKTSKQKGEEEEEEEEEEDGSFNPVFTDMGLFVKSAMRAKHIDEIRRMESQWTHILSQVSEMPNMIPILDMSLFHLQPDRFYEALGLACIVALKSCKRILMFDQTTHFVSLDGCKTLKEILFLLRPVYYEHHIGQNFKSVCDIIITSMTSSSSSSSIQNIKLALFTYYDQIETIQNIVQESFENAGFVKSPPLLVWRANQTVPSSSASSASAICHKKPDTFIFSGNANYTWTRISQLPPEAWENMNAFDFIAYLLNQPRYDLFENYFQRLLSVR